MSKPLLWEIEELGRVSLLRMCYVDLTGDLIAGLLLSQIVWWFRPGENNNSKMHIYRSERYWVAKERSAWRHEIGISPKQFDRACEILVSKGIIVTELYKFNGKPLVHVSLEIGNLSKLLEGLIPKVKVHFTQRSKSILPKGQNHIGKKTIKKTTKKTKGASTMKASEVIEKHNSKHKPKTGFPTDFIVKNATELGKWWCRFVPYYHNVGFVKPLTQKELGVLSKIRVQVGEDRAYTIMLNTVRYWDDFIKMVSDDKNVTVSSKPTVFEFLKHCDTAVNLYMTGNEKNNTLQLIAPKGSTIIPSGYAKVGKKV